MRLRSLTLLPLAFGLLLPGHSLTALAASPSYGLPSPLDDEGPKQLDIRSSHEWCTTAGLCDGLNGTADYHYAEADAFTYTPPRVGKPVSTAEEIYAACAYSYTDSAGTRHLEQTWVQARVFPGNLGNLGTILGIAAVPTPNADRGNPRALGVIQATVSRSDHFVAVNPDSGPVSYVASNTAVISGHQYTDNRSTTILSGGMHITISGTIRYYHRALETQFGYAYWHFDGTGEGSMTCDTTVTPDEATTLQERGHDIFAIPT